MKIRPLTPDNHSRVTALLQQAFPGSSYELNLVEKFHKSNVPVHEWICLHVNKVVAYIGFSNALNGSTVCGLHLAPLAVKPEFQGQGIGSELVRFALRQEMIRKQTLFVLGNTGFYQRFGFAPCTIPICPFTKNNEHFAAIRNSMDEQFTVGYEACFKKQS
jgi:putative acetyltransferase